MKILLDTCVVMDFLQQREPFAEDARKVFLAAAKNEFAGYITAKSTTDIYYLMHRFTHNKEESHHKLNMLLSIVGLLDTTESDIIQALSSDRGDFEDSVMIETALRYKIDFIITRNQKDFINSTVPVLSPAEFLAKLSSK